MSAAPDFREIQRRQLGGAIRRRRHGRGLTLAQLSLTAGVSVSMLSQVERGLLDPSLDTLRNKAHPNLYTYRRTEMTLADVYDRWGQADSAAAHRALSRPGAPLRVEAVPVVAVKP